MDTSEKTHVAGSLATQDNEPATDHGHPSEQDEHAHPPTLPPSRGTHVAAKMLLGLCVVGGMLVLGVLPRLQQRQKLEAMAATRRHTATLVDVVHPHYAANTDAVLLPGNVQAIEETTINARTSGYLRRRFVDIGSHVRAGQVLAEIEAPELDQQLMRARAQASQSQAGREQAEADETRLNANVAQARAELARTQSNLEAARADLAHSRAKLLETQGARSEAVAKLDQTRRKLTGQKANLDRARTHLTLATKTWKRWQELARGGAVSGQELDETEAEYESAQAAVASAQADVESAQADVDAAQQAINSRDGDVAAAQADVTASTQKVSAARAGVTSARANVEAMQANVLASKANVRAAQANIEASQANVAGYASLKGFERVVAPFDGVITARNVDTGDLINAGSSANATADPTSTVPHSGLFGIARTDVLRVQVQVPQSAVSTTRRGQTARILVQEYPGRVFEGTIFDTAGALDATSRTLLTEVRVKNPDGVLMPGMYAQVQFVDSRSHPAIRVPANTLIIDADGIRVATVTPNSKLHFQQVKVGRDYGKEAEITEGLAGNERLITNPTDELTEGMPVRIASPSK